MKATEFANFLGQYALQLRELRAYDYATCISELSKIFRARSATATVGTVLKPLSKSEYIGVESGSDVEMAMSSLKIVILTLKEFGKPALVKDIRSTIAALEPFKNSDFADLVRHLESLKPLPTTKASKKPVREELVAFYNDRLISALNNEIEFSSIYSELNADKKLTSDELKRLAKLFRGETVKSGPAALKSIWGRHQTLLDSNARTRASAGRSAA